MPGQVAAMTCYVAFLRAINVGGHTVKMENLRRLFAELGFANVATFIASGNVIFESSAAANELEPQIESHLQQALGYAVATFLRTAAEVAAITQYSAFPQVRDDPHASHHVAFLRVSPGAESQHRILALTTATDEFHFHQRETSTGSAAPARAILPLPTQCWRRLSGCRRPSAT